MTTTRDDFEHWLLGMDEEIEGFVHELPTEVATKLDYTIDSLTILEAWLLERYESIDDLLDESEMMQLDAMSRYVGETMRKTLGGIWDIDLKNKKNAFYQMPVIERKDFWIECPVTLLTAATDRGTGTYLAEVLNELASRHGSV